MQKLLILSGKGGTGKTTIAAAFIKYLQSKSYADCDVDAPNLHIAIPPSGEPLRENYYALPKAYINVERCTYCNTCQDFCKFHAIKMAKEIYVDRNTCEGCGVCEYVCKAGAISLTECISGETRVYQGERHFSTAELTMGSGATGKLVAKVKSNMKNCKDEIAVIDGSPGIGCPVIASITGVDMVLLVTEPTVSGLSDLSRVLKTVQHFGTKCAVCINKYTLNEEQSDKIAAFCEEQGVLVVGKIPYDDKTRQAVNEGKSIITMDCNAAKNIQSVIDKTIKILKEDKDV